MDEKELTKMPSRKELIIELLTKDPTLINLDDPFIVEKFESQLLRLEIDYDQRILQARELQEKREHHQAIIAELKEIISATNLNKPSNDQVNTYITCTCGNDYSPKISKKCPRCGQIN